MQEICNNIYSYNFTQSNIQKSFYSTYPLHLINTNPISLFLLITHLCLILYFLYVKMFLSFQEWFSPYHSIKTRPFSFVYKSYHRWYDFSISFNNTLHPAPRFFSYTIKIFTFHPNTFMIRLTPHNYIFCINTVFVQYIDIAFFVKIIWSFFKNCKRWNNTLVIFF